MRMALQSTSSEWGAYGDPQGCSPTITDEASMISTAVDVRDIWSGCTLEFGKEFEKMQKQSALLAGIRATISHTHQPPRYIICHNRAYSGGQASHNPNL